jgi:hypothetical protein
MERWQVPDYSLESYREFLRLKNMPIHRVEGGSVYFEDLAGAGDVQKDIFNPSLFDYERFIVALALRKKRFAVFADVGLGKTFMFLEWTRHVSKLIYPKKVLIISQLHLIKQTIDEQIKFYRFSNIADINALYGGSAEKFLAIKNGPMEGSPVGIINVDKFNEAYRLQDEIGAVVLDESSCLKHETAVRRTNIINSCKGIEYKLACTATPAPNDRQEYANHALFLGYIDNFKQFFTKFFYNTGSGNEFVMKPHAKTAFYAFLATFSIFLKSPARYGFADNLHDLKPAQVIWDSISLTDEQRVMAQKFGSKGQMGCFGFNAGGMTNRNKLSQIAKGFVYDRAAN